MKANVVLADRTLRVGAGMLLLASPLLELHTYPYNLLGLVVLATGVVGYCPLYSVLRALSSTKSASGPAHGAAHKV